MAVLVGARVAAVRVAVVVVPRHPSRAASVVRALIMQHNDEDWRDWVVHVQDELDEEIFVMPFAFVLGKPH